MASFLFRQRAKTVDWRQFTLSSYAPSIALDGLQTGIDNVRSDVFLSVKFGAVARAHIAKLIARYGGVEDLASEPQSRPKPGSALAWRGSGEGQDFKSVLADLELGALNRAKSEGNIQVDLVCRLAVVKLLRAELAAQFNTVLNLCRAKLKAFEGPRQANAPAAIELRERIARLQISKKTILRRVGEELSQTLHALEKEHLLITRLSFFGDAQKADYDLLRNSFLFSEDARDDYINAEHFVLLGNFERDPDRFHLALQLARELLKASGLGREVAEGESGFDGWLACPENVEELLGFPNASSDAAKTRAQQTLLKSWVDLLDRESVLLHAIAAYETPALMAKYSPSIHPQELKQALIWREERKRVEQALRGHGKDSAAEDLHAAIKRVAGCRGASRDSVAAKFLHDLVRYNRELLQWQALMGALDQINLIVTDKLRELSAINSSLYEFMLSDERRSAESKIVDHVVLKADIRDSSALTRTLFERGLNPASYFSLNFYEPVNKLLPKYGATKLFIEGDAVILGLLERVGEPQPGVGRTCVLAREMIEIVRGYNRKSQDAGLPTLELGIGICYQDSAPMYLVDGTQQIMISPALNESDRLSSCSRAARRMFRDSESLFNVYCFQTIDDADAGGEPEEFLLRYNIGGIHLNEAAFRKLQQEITLELREVSLPSVWDEGLVRLYCGVVPVSAGTFHNIVIREAVVPQVDPREFQLKKWGTSRYYEVCTNEKVYESVGQPARGAGA